MHLCCLCQTGSGEMRCPAQSKRSDKSAGYIIYLQSFQHCTLQAVTNIDDE